MAVDPAELAHYALSRDTTRREHLQELIALGEFRSFDAEAQRELAALLLPAALSTDSGIKLIETLVLEMRSRRIVLPSLSTLERLVYEVRSRTQSQVLHQMTRSLTAEQKASLDCLLLPDAELSPHQTLLTWLRHADGKTTALTILRFIKRIQVLKRLGIPEEMGLQTLYPKPNLSKSGGRDHVIYPYLLRNLVIDRPNQVWGVDITYIRLSNGWMYLVAFLDWFSRLVVAWELSDTLELGFVLSCRDAALAQALPQIVNSDQGSHFTSERFTERLLVAGVQISMDGRGRCMDNIFTERLWRSVKYEEVYLSEYASPQEAREGIGRYLAFYNEARPHQALGYATPAEIHAMPPTGGVESFLKSAPILS